MWTAETTLGNLAFPLAEMQSAQLLMVAGFVMLGWVLARRQLGLRKRVNRDTRAAKRALRVIREHKEPALPLIDAPPETQRWQVAIFDLQRELKAELDTRISVVQALMRQLDDRIERLTDMEQQTAQSDSLATGTSRRGCTPQQYQAVTELARSGHTSNEIATRTGISVGDVELILGTIRL